MSHNAECPKEGVATYALFVFEFMVKLSEGGIFALTSSVDSSVAASSSFRDGSNLLVLDFTFSSNLVVFAISFRFEQIILFDVMFLDSQQLIKTSRDGIGGFKSML